MSLKVILVVCVAVGVSADRSPIYHAQPTYAPPTYAPPPKYAAPPTYAKEPEYPTAPPKYAYNYAVADDYSGANFLASESRDGYKTEGSYTVDLPDGRKQTVTYVDNGDGLEAVVSYEGEAQYPDHKPQYKPDPVYKPAPYAPPPKYGA